MAKSNRATRKELETVIQKMIEDIGFLRQSFIAIDNYLGAYVKYKGDTVEFNNFISRELSKVQEKKKIETKEPENKDIKSAKQNRYQKIETPL